MRPTPRGIHTKPNHGLSDEWISPQKIVVPLGPFDLDPCACPGQFYRTAKLMIAPPRDGLAAKWKGRVWLNPPYAQIAVWMKRMAEHNHGTALVASRTEVERWFWPFVWESATAILFIRGRLYFHRPDGTQEGNAGHGSVLAAYGGTDAAILEQSGIVGKYIRLIRSATEE
jgi:hypothetical protein